METGMSASAGKYRIIYRFTLKPDVWSDFLELQKKTHAIYSRHVSYTLEFVRSEVDPNDVIEVQTYPSQGDAKKIENLHEKEPELAGLFKKFLTLLDPSKGNIETTVGESLSL